VSHEDRILETFLLDHGGNIIGERVEIVPKAWRFRAPVTTPVKRNTAKSAIDQRGHMAAPDI
jgi:hypothetical protein